MVFYEGYAFIPALYQNIASSNKSEADNPDIGHPWQVIDKNAGV